jgi:cell division protein FtsI (penicillin-binding protein 3)
MPRAQRTLRARLALTLLLVLATVSVFVVRLVDIQVVQAAALTEESTNRRSVPVTTYAPRGEILDANGEVLADSTDRWDITASPRIALASRSDPLQASAEAIAAITGQDAAQIVSAIEAKPDADHAYLSRSVTLEQLRLIQDLDISWLYDEYRPSRNYPLGSVAGNLVGFIGTDGPQAGLEISQNDCLASTDGVSTYERGADGVRLPGSTVTETQAEEGGTLQLTIDSDLQFFVQQAIGQQATALGAESANAVVMDADTGELLAVADWPSVDPNNVDASGADQLGAKTFSAPYEPGSTIKAVTAAGLLDAGDANPGSKVVAPYELEVGDGTIKDSFVHEDLQLTLAGVLQNSSNTGIAQLAEYQSVEQRHDYLQRFGFGRDTEVGFYGESGGLFAADADDWDSRTALNTTFGQGFSATAVQIASAYQALANDGVRMPVTLVKSCTAADGAVTQVPTGEGTRVVSADAADTTVRMLESVVQDGFLSNSLMIDGYRVAAKSGTAEIAEGGVYTSDRVISIAGMAPAEDPQYVVVATLTKPDTIKTSAGAAPTFREIMSHVLTTYRVPPSSQPAELYPETW